MHKTTVELRGLSLEAEYVYPNGNVGLIEVYHKGDEIMFLIDDANYTAIRRDIERQIREGKCHI